MLTDIQTLQETPECIEDVMRYIRAHINEPLNREMLAAVAGFSVPIRASAYSASGAPR